MGSLADRLRMIKKDEKKVEEVVKQGWFLEYGIESHYVDGIVHSVDDKPSQIFPDGSKFWFKNGLRHRANGLPSTIYPNGDTFFHEDGQMLFDTCECGLPKKYCPANKPEEILDHGMLTGLRDDDDKQFKASE